MVVFLLLGQEGTTLMYRLSPPNLLTWCDDGFLEVIQLAEEHGSDLANLEWQQVEDREFSSDLLRLAFRYGTAACSNGVVIRAVDAVNVGRADDLRLHNRVGRERHADLRNQNAPLENIMPGWRAHGQELDERVSQNTERSAQGAESDLAQQLDAPPKPGVVAHWERLGGALPDPV